MTPKSVVLDETGVRRAVRRLGHQLVEGGGDLSELALVGIRTRGVPLARRLQSVINEAEGVDVPVGELDITLYRDDVLTGLGTPEVRTTLLPFEIANRRVVLVDDVLYTGRTVRAALDAVMDWGRPRSIQLAVLVDRGHRELPVQADFIGLNLETSAGESVQDVFMRWTKMTLSSYGKREHRNETAKSIELASLSPETITQLLDIADTFGGIAQRQVKRSRLCAVKPWSISLWSHRPERSVF